MSAIEKIREKAKLANKHIVLAEGTEPRTVQAAAMIRDQWHRPPHPRRPQGRSRSEGRRVRHFAARHRNRRSGDRRAH